jgi:hypothetical protein
MTITEAKQIINDADYVAAYSQFARSPMDTYDATYKLAVDWLQATLTLASLSETN